MCVRVGALGCVCVLGYVCKCVCLGVCACVCVQVCVLASEGMRAQRMLVLDTNLGYKM